MAHPYWPLLDLVVRTARLELRLIDDNIAVELAGIADPSMFADNPGDTSSQFKTGWVNTPSPERERQSLQFWWRNRAGITASQWNLDLAVVVDGRPAGCQSVKADDFRRRRHVLTGSWLAREFQGNGLGTEMRQAVLHLAFDGLGSLQAESSAFETNVRSIAVSRRVGYEENGRWLRLRAGGRLATEICFRMTEERYREHRRDDIEIVGLEPCLELLGASRETLDET